MHRFAWLLVGLVLLLPSACGGSDAGGLKVVLSHGANSRPYLPWPPEVAAQIAGDLEEAGFVVEIRPEPWSSYIPTVEQGKHQLALLGWSADVPDTDNFVRALLHSDSAVVGKANNISFYRSDAFDGYLDEARRSHDPVARIELYRKAQEQVFNDVPMVPLVFTDRRIAHRKVFGPLEVEWVTHPILRRIQTPVDGTLVFLRGGDSNSLDAGDVTDGESSKVIEQVYDQLVRYKPGTQEIEPCLATSWASSEDHKTWTLQIREGVKFHDGAALDGAAVVASFERQRDPKHPFAFPDGRWSNWKGLFGFVEKVEVGSHPMEVVFRCSEPAPPFFMKQLGMFTCSIISPKALEEHGSRIRIHPVGTGPFKFVKWDSGREIHLERNDDYWDGPPKLETLYFRISQDATVRADRLRSDQGGADLIDNLGPDTIPVLEQDPNVVVARRPLSSLCYLAMNTMKPPFDNPKVREAVAYAIDKASLIKLAYRGYAAPAHVPVPPGFIGHHEDLVDRKRDVEKAKTLLREAGYDVD
jgi:ABC-type transport system substrate-binding protein